MQSLSSAEIDRMIIPRNYVLIRLEKIFNDELKFQSGVKLFIDPSWNPQDHIKVWGTIKKLPEKLYFNKKDPNGLEFLPVQELVEGDEVCIDYYSVLMALGRAANKLVEGANELSYIDENKNVYALISYQDLFLTLRDGEPYPINGYVLLTEVEEHFSKHIVIPGNLRSIKSMKVGIIKYIGKCNLAYQHHRYHDAVELNVGDVVIFHNYSNRKIENDLHAKLPSMSAVQRRYIHAKFDGDLSEFKMSVQYFK